MGQAVLHSVELFAEGNWNRQPLLALILPQIESDSAYILLSFTRIAIKKSAVQLNGAP